MGHVVAALLVLAIGAAADPDPGLYRGVVVDEAGQPVPGVEVAAAAFSHDEVRRVTAADGSFALPIADNRVAMPDLIARTADGGRAGYFPRQPRTRDAAPARVVLKPGRPLAVRVAGPDGAPIPDATVGASDAGQVLAEATTGPDGTASLTIPADARVACVFALKPGRGLDYSEHGEIPEKFTRRVGAAASDLPGRIDLVLDGARTVKIRAVDAADKPLAGVTFDPSGIRKPGRRDSLIAGRFRPLAATTDAEGIATFDYLPGTPQGKVMFLSWGWSHGSGRLLIPEGEAGEVTVRLVKHEAIRGRVARADGSPAPGIKIQARGSRLGSPSSTASAWSRADGSYTLLLPPGDTFLVQVDDPDWAAPGRHDVALQPGRPVEGIDFPLTRGTILRGRVTLGPDARPVANQAMILEAVAGDQAPPGGVEDEDPVRNVRNESWFRTDAEGRYTIRVGPGRFKLWGPARAGTVDLTVGSEPEIVHDFRMPRPEKGPLAGRVVEAATGKGVAGAKIQFAAPNRRSMPSSGITADADGRFLGDRHLDPLTIQVYNPDRSLGAIVKIGAEDREITIPIEPTASGTALLLDEAGRPAANQGVVWGQLVPWGKGTQLWSTLTAARVVTDASGRFTMQGLVVGQDHGIRVNRELRLLPVGRVRADAPGPFDAGTFRIEGEPPPQFVEEMSFSKGSPGVGEPAPDFQALTLDGRPLELADFRGKFVLLEFWATWARPSINEMPYVQAVHDAFGKDERFTILSLSIDNQIEEPRAFQEERKRPWTQASLRSPIFNAIPAIYGIRAVPAFVLVGPDGRIVARGMRGDAIKTEVARALGARP